MPVEHRITTASIIKEVIGYRSATLPVDVVEIAKHCLLDWIGVTLSGSRERVTAILLNQALAEGGREQGSVLGHAARVTVAQACLINGTAGHSQDYDDVLEMMLGHPTVPVAPVVLALAEHDGRSGADVVAAFVAGFQVEAAVGVLVEPQHHEQGWHTTATLGTFGAAAAACHLLGADEEQWGRALGLAATSAGGVKSMFGTMAKPFHAGKAAALGYQAAALAIAGLTSATDVLEARQGFVEVTTPAAVPWTARRGMPTHAIREVLFKPHASCYLTHSAIEGVLRLAREHDLRPADVERIELDVLPVHLATCALTTATTGLEAKFSLAYCAAIALAEGRAGEAELTDDVVAASDVRAIAERVVLLDAEAGRPQMATPVRIVTWDGRVLGVVVDVGTPTRREDLPAQWTRLVAKFVDLATPVVGAADARRIVELVTVLEDLPSLDELMLLVASQPSSALT